MDVEPWRTWGKNAPANALRFFTARTLGPPRCDRSDRHQLELLEELPADRRVTIIIDPEED